MPTNHVSAEKMGVGAKGSGKHWTRAEVDARQAAADGVRRKRRVTLRAPSWLSADALKVFARIKRQVAGLDLLDNLDADMLAVYADAVVKYREASQKLGGENLVPDQDEAIKACQAWARLVAAYADKLGFTPAARARLVKRKADEVLDSFGDEFDG